MRFVHNSLGGENQLNYEQIHNVLLLCHFNDIKK